MPIIWTDDARYRQVEYENEADLEAAIIQVQSCLFGEDRYYLDIKKKIGAKGSIQNIPDGYLLDLSGSKPRLYVVENELAAHDPLRHIAVQILQFSLSFEAEPPKERYRFASGRRLFFRRHTLPSRYGPKTVDGQELDPLANGFMCPSRLREVILLCTRRDPKTRPTMQQVVRVLSGESWASICAEVGAQLERQKRFVGLALAAGFLFAIPFLFEE